MQTPNMVRSGSQQNTQTITSAPNAGTNLAYSSSGMIRPQTNDVNDKAVLRSTASSQAMQQLPKMMVAAGSGHQIVKLKRPASNHRPMSGNPKQPEQQPSPM